MLLISMSLNIYAQIDEKGELSHITSNSPEYFADNVFMGPDKKMPIDGHWRIAVEPTIKDGDIFIPVDLHEAFIELERMLPNWYEAALHASWGRSECFVLVNNLALHVDVMNWLWINWQLNYPNSLLRSALEKIGAENSNQILFGIHDGFCFYLKYGESRALELLALPVDEWGDRELPLIINPARK